MSVTLLIDCLYLVSTVLQVLYIFCYLAVAFHQRSCSSLPCLAPYMILQLVLSASHLFLAILYRVTGQFDQAGLRIIRLLSESYQEEELGGPGETGDQPGVEEVEETPDGVVETVATSRGRRRVRGQSWSSQHSGSSRAESHTDCSRDFRNAIFYVMRKVLKYCLDSRDPLTC